MAPVNWFFLSPFWKTALTKEDTAFDALYDLEPDDAEDVGDRSVFKSRSFFGALPDFLFLSIAFFSFPAGVAGRRGWVAWPRARDAADWPEPSATR